MVKNTSADVEMKDASSPSTGTETNGVEEPKKDPDLLTLEGEDKIFYDLLF